MLPPKDLLPKLKEESESIKTILEEVKYRAEWIKYQERQKQKEEEALERERGILSVEILLLYLSKCLFKSVIITFNLQLLMLK